MVGVMLVHQDMVLVAVEQVVLADLDILLKLMLHYLRRDMVV
jgi:hypothetical protein